MVNQLKKRRSIMSAAGYGIAVSWFVVLLVMIVLTYLLYCNYIDLPVTRIAVPLLLYAGGTIGALVAGSIAYQSGIYASAVTMVGVSASQMILCMLLFDVNFSGIAINLIVNTAAGITAIILSAGKEKTTQRHKKRRRVC